MAKSKERAKRVKHSLPSVEPLGMLVLPSAGDEPDDRVLVERAYWLRERGLRAHVAVPQCDGPLFKERYPVLSRAGDFFSFYDSVHDLLALSASFTAIAGSDVSAIPLMNEIVERHRRLVPTFFVHEAHRDAVLAISSPTLSGKWKPASSRAGDGRLVLFSDSRWLCDNIQRECGVQVNWVRSGVDLSIYHPPAPQHSLDGVVRIAAPVRPSLPGSGSERTMRVLKSIEARLGNAVEIQLFGCDDDVLAEHDIPTNFRFTNYGLLIREQEARLLRTADVFLDLSDRSPTPRPGLLAMACGCAVVVPSAGASAEYAADRRDALIVDTSQFNACVDAAIEVVTNHDLRHRLEAAAAATARGYSGAAAAQSDEAFFTGLGAFPVIPKPADVRRVAPSPTGRAVELEQMGREAHHLGDYQQAIDLLEQAIAEDDSRFSPWLWLSRAQLALKDVSAALESIRAGLSREPRSPKGILHLAAVLHARGERTETITLLTGLLRRHGHEPDIAKSVTQRLLRMEAYQDAAEAATLLLQHNRFDEDGVVAMAMALVAADDQVGARQRIASSLPVGSPIASRVRIRVSLAVKDPLGAWEEIQRLSDQDNSVPHVMQTARGLMEAGHLSLACQAAERAVRMGGSDPETLRKRDNIVGETVVLRGEWAAPSLQAGALMPTEGRILHVVGASVPYRQSGYTVRTQYLVDAQRQVGLDPHIVTPLGFPWTGGVTTAPLFEEVGGVPHHRLAPGETAQDEHAELDLQTVTALLPARPDDRLSLGVARLAALVDRLRPQVLHAASDFRNALVALTVGNAFGIPVVYEMRGFWEETWLSHREAQAALSEAYCWRKDRETQCAIEADRVVTLADVMKVELVSRGIPAEKILVIPNAVDINAFVPVGRDPDLARRLGIEPDESVLGYISSLTPYEGIRYLIDAAAALVRDGHPVKVLLVGDGVERDPLERHAAEAGLADRVIFTGRVPHADILRYYGLIDVFVVPRTDDRVSRLVTPLKPYEAMATGRAVVVSGVPALREMVLEGETGLVFEPEDADHLAAVVAPLLRDRGRRAVMGRTAREWVSQHRTWVQNGRRYVELYDSLKTKDKS